MLVHILAISVISIFICQLVFGVKDYNKEKLESLDENCKVK